METQKGVTMAESLEVLKYRHNKLMQNGKNEFGTGIARKLYYQIIQAEEKAKRS